MRPYAFDLGSGKYLSMCVYVDNLVTAAADAADAVRAMKCFEEELDSNWSLSLKDGSREVIVPEPNPQAFSSEEYPRKNMLTCLGHQIAESGSLGPDWLPVQKTNVGCLLADMRPQGHAKA